MTKLRVSNRQFRHRKEDLRSHRQGQEVVLDY
jgi:hypothetical protein